jgi:hypothetical protein
MRTRDREVVTWQNLKAGEEAPTVRFGCAYCHEFEVYVKHGLPPTSCPFCGGRLTPDAYLFIGEDE